MPPLIVSSGPFDTFWFRDPFKAPITSGLFFDAIAVDIQRRLA